MFFIIDGINPYQGTMGKARIAKMGREVYKRKKGLNR